MSELNANTEVFELLSNPISGDNPLLQILKSDNDEINSFRKRITKYARESPSPPSRVSCVRVVCCVLCVCVSCISVSYTRFLPLHSRVRRAVLKEREALVRQLSEAHSNSKYDTSFLPQYRCDFGVRVVNNYNYNYISLN